MEDYISFCILYIDEFGIDWGLWCKYNIVIILDEKWNLLCMNVYD